MLYTAFRIFWLNSRDILCRCLLHFGKEWAALVLLRNMLVKIFGKKCSWARQLKSGIVVWDLWTTLNTKKRRNTLPVCLAYLWVLLDIHSCWIIILYLFCQIQMILPYTTSCVRSSSDIPLLSLSLAVSESISPLVRFCAFANQTDTKMTAENSFLKR